MIIRKLALFTFVAAFVVGALYFAGDLADKPQEAVAVTEARQPGCDIKGNIDRTGERVYHAPGSRFYVSTYIEPTVGERWFCTEADAEAAGWRKSPH